LRKNQEGFKVAPFAGFFEDFAKQARFLGETSSIAIGSQRPKMNFSNTSFQGMG